MSDGSAAEFPVAYDAPPVAETKLFLRVKSMPWVRIVLDALLVAGLLLASSSLLVQR